MKKTIAICLWALIVFGVTLLIAYDMIKKDATVKDEPAAVTEKTLQATDGQEQKTATDGKKTKAGKENKKSSKKSVKKTKAEQSAEAKPGYGPDNEAENFILPKSAKKKFTGKKFNARVNQVARFLSEFPDRTWNEHSYSKFIEQRKASGMSDAASIALQGNNPEEMFHNFLVELSGNPALAVGWADFMARHILFEDGDTLGNVVPALQEFVKADDQALANAIEYNQLWNRKAFLSKGDPERAKIAKRMRELEGQCGVEHWLEPSPKDPSVGLTRKCYIKNVAVLINCLKVFQLMDVQNVESSVNYHLPSSGEDTMVKLVENPRQEQNQPVLVLGKIDKNGTIIMKFGPDVKDMRPVKVLEYSVIKKREYKPAPSTPTPPPSHQGGSDTAPIINPTPTPPPAPTPPPKKRTKKDQSKGEKVKTGGGGSIIVIPIPDDPDPKPKPHPTPDGQGDKNQADSSAYQGNAPDLSGHQSPSDGDGTKEPEPKKPNNTVTEGSPESGRRDVKDYNPSYNGDAEHGNKATIGSTETDNTTPQYHDGDTTSEGEHVDQQIDYVDEHVEEAPADLNMNQSDAAAGFTLDATEGE